MTQQDFVDRYPLLYHMATAQAKVTIDLLGLLSTDAILDLVEIDPALKMRLKSERRPEMTELRHPEYGTFYLRDQKPMTDKALEKCLDGMSVSEWYQNLNSRVFMWATRDRVEALLAARAYRDHDQLVLTIDTRKFAERHFDQIEVATLNSGSTLYTPLRRGKQTFVPIRDFDGGKSSKPIVEVTVLRGIPDFRDFILEASIRTGAHR